MKRSSFRLAGKFNMKNVVILGSSPAGIKAAEEIRKTDPEAEISVFCEGNTLPFNREILGNFVAGEIKEENIFYRPKEFYKAQKINVILGKKIQRVDFKKNRLITEEKEQVLFDTLIINDVPMIRLPDIKGAQKMGVFHLRRLSDAKDLLSVLHLVDALTIQADGILALKTAVGIRKKKKEIIWILPSSHVLSGLMDREPADFLAKELEENGIRIVRENAIAEVLGEGDVKAIRLKTGKVIATQAVMIGGALPELKLFSETALKLNAGILTNGIFKTNLDNVFALDHVCQKDQETFQSQEDASLSALEEQGRVAGKTICNEAVSCEEPLFTASFDIFGLNCALIGMTKYADGMKEYLKTDASAKMYRKIFVKNNCAVGAILINCADEHEKTLNYIKGKQDISALDSSFLGECAPVQTVESTGALTQTGAEVATDGA